MAKILVIEDDVTFLDLVRVHLAGAGHEVITAEDAVIGLRAVIADQPDLVVLDIFVPYLDGFEMLAALQSDPATRGIPVIVLTGHSDDETFSRARQLGAAAFLTKPVEGARLIRVIEEQLAARPRSGAAPE
ncbi:MAG: response regulator [Burkholderiales bacterium]